MAGALPTLPARQGWHGGNSVAIAPVSGPFVPVDDHRHHGTCHATRGLWYWDQRLPLLPQTSASDKSYFEHSAPHTAEYRDRRDLGAEVVSPAGQTPVAPEVDNSMYERYPVNPGESMSIEQGGLALQQVSSDASRGPLPRATVAVA